MSFDDVWSVWPKNDRGQKPNKGGALKAFEKKTKVQKIAPEVIFDAAKKVADWYDRHPKEQRYVKHLQTWINADGWIGVDEEFPAEAMSLRQKFRASPAGADPDRRRHLLSVLQDLKRKAVQFNVSYDGPIKEVEDKLEAFR